MKRVCWLAVAAIGIALYVLASAECGAQARCPWLNAATAAGVLGGEVQMTVTMAPESEMEKGADADGYSAPEQRFNRGDALCEFTRKGDTGLYVLRIDVKTMNDPPKQFASFLAHCKGVSVPLTGIGNEAVQCGMQDDASLGREQVIARVRERVFTLTINRPPASPTASEKSSGTGLRDDTRNVAEQVAGSIF
jgi:hypothetical protein